MVVLIMKIVKNMGWFVIVLIILLDRLYWFLDNFLLLNWVKKGWCLELIVCDCE